MTSNVEVDAVLMPYSVSRRIFGKEVAKNYAIVQLTISNHDSTDAFTVQSVFLDYSNWLFSGAFSSLPPAGASGNTLTNHQTQNNPSQVASAESRLVRSELQDAQQWTARNWFIRGAVLVGSVASGFQFLYGTDYAKGVSAYSSNVVPGLQLLWPDATQAQINHISDFGFRTNYNIPKGASDIVVAFFPLDRFLTPDLRKLFLKSPAAFFNPGEMILDSNLKAMLLKMLNGAGLTVNAQDLVTAVAHYQLALDQATKARIAANAGKPEAVVPVDLSDLCGSQPTSPLAGNDCSILTLLDRVSLNNIRVVASGELQVATDKVPAIISDIEFADDATLAATWAKGETKHTATLIGSFFTGGTLTVTAKNAQGKDIKGKILDSITQDSSSDDTHFIFSYTVPDTIASGDKLSFLVNKKAKDGSATQGVPYSYTVNYPAAATTDTPKPTTPTATANGQQGTTPAAGSNGGGAATGAPSDGHSKGNENGGAKPPKDKH